MSDIKNKRFRELVNEIVELHEKKMKDYGTITDPIANLREFGLYGVVIRLNDKMMRLKSFVRNGQLYVKDESVIDTLKDVATYALLGVQLYEEEKTTAAPDYSIVGTVHTDVCPQCLSPFVNVEHPLRPGVIVRRTCKCIVFGIPSIEPSPVVNTTTSSVKSKVLSETPPNGDNYPSLPSHKRRFKLPKV